MTAQMSLGMWPLWAGLQLLPHRIPLITDRLRLREQVPRAEDDRVTPPLGQGSRISAHTGHFRRGFDYCAVGHFIQKYHSETSERLVCDRMKVGRKRARRADASLPEDFRGWAYMETPTPMVRLKQFTTLMNQGWRHPCLAMCQKRLHRHVRRGARGIRACP